ncbi:MAG: hypothetical protein FWD74_01215 [Actinomycetia bacterium]|nr:hypothetical protein [Actinomycetes bacterium]
MSIRANRRVRLLTVAGVVAVAIAVPIVTAAATPGPSTTPSPAPTGSSAAQAAKSSAAAGLGPAADAAASKSKAALEAAPPSGSAAGKSAAAQHGPFITDPAAVAAFANKLRIDTATAQRALEQVGALSGEDGITDPDTQLAPIARSLGVTVAQLNDALFAAKQALAHR